MKKKDFIGFSPEPAEEDICISGNSLDTTYSYEDYKYVMADTSFLYLGVRYRFEELIEVSEIPFKFRTIVERYLLPETDLETTLESELYYMKPNGIMFKTFRQLKCKVKFSRKKADGKFETTVMKIEDFAAIPADVKQLNQILIQELAISKLALMVFSV